MYLGLPLPRVETLPSGGEYYITLDKDGYLKYLADTFGSRGEIDIVNPLSGRAINRIPSSINERVAMINQARSTCITEAPINSYSRNPIFDGIDLTSISTPSPSTPEIVDLFNKGKSAEIIVDVDLTPKAGPSRLPDIDYNLEDPFN